VRLVSQRVRDLRIFELSLVIGKLVGTSSIVVCWKYIALVVVM